MSANSSIEWTDRTWNPVRGCSIVSPGCVNCYAMKQAHRFSGPGKPYEGLTKLTSRSGPQWTGKVRTIDAALLEPLSWRKPSRVFVNSMSDLFHDGVPDSFISEVFATMALTPRHTFQILTKRPDRMREFFSHPGRAADVAVAVFKRFSVLREADVRSRASVKAWPLPNVWLGVSVENQATADERIPLLLQTPATVRFISAEPLLGPVFLLDYLTGDAMGHETGGPAGSQTGPAVDWLIVGGESGPGARPCAVEHVRDLVHQCRAARTSCFVKQLGAVPVLGCSQCGRQVGPVLCGWVDACGPTHAALIAESKRLRNRKGADMAEWPEDLRVREFPR